MLKFNYLFMEDTDQLSDEEDAAEEALGPTQLAVQVRKLKLAVWNATATRERLPQPLFWSLFRSEVEGIRQRRAANWQKRRSLICPDISNIPGVGDDSQE